MTEDNEKEENINVVLRIKAKTVDETNSNFFQKNISNSKKISIFEKGQTKEYAYDYIADEKSTQNEIFENCAKKICDNCLEGYNGTIFAYGQTGSGKTYTLLGKKMTNILENKNLTNIDMEENISNENNEEVGLIQRILQYLFKRSKEKEENGFQFEFSISYMEIYLENIKDLLERNNFKNVEIREDENGKINLINLNKIKIDSPEQALQYLNYGNSLRQTAPTLKNQKSSRSHAIFTIYIENKIKSSVFHIIDLAGSESQKGAGTFGQRRRSK